MDFTHDGFFVQHSGLTVFSNGTVKRKKHGLGNRMVEEHPPFLQPLEPARLIQRQIATTAQVACIMRFQP